MPPLCARGLACSRPATRRRERRAGWPNRGMDFTQSRIVLRTPRRRWRWSPAQRRAQGMEIVIGVDPHKATNVVAAIDEQGELVEQQTFAANRKGLRTLERWAKRFPKRRWAVEGAGGIGRPLAQKLLAVGERVVDVPPKLSSRVRVLSTGNARKNDRLDATFVALAALRNDRLTSVQPEDGPEGHVV